MRGPREVELERAVMVGVRVGVVREAKATMVAQGATEEASSELGVGTAYR